jgi:D-alanyl-D-alanine carboxypeptidase
VAAQSVSLPDWLVPQGGVLHPVRNRSSTPLWSGPDDRAVQFNVLPAGSRLQPLGPFAGGRLLVHYDGDGERAAGPGWVDVAALEPTSLAGTPEPLPAASAAFASPVPGLDAANLALQDLSSPSVALPRRIDQASPPAVTARYVAILDGPSGQLLYSRDASTRVAPASTTKIMTTLVALERANGDLDRVIPVTVNGAQMAARDGSSVMWLEPGERVTLRTLLYGMMLPSGNDAAEQVALALGVSREQYVAWMNQKAAELGLRDTSFANPSGMDAPGHYSSAYDMALMARYAMQIPAFRDMASAYDYVADGYSLRNANRLIGWYTGADGVKIGFTDDARKTMVASATRNGRRVYVSIMRSEDLVSDPIALFEWVWDSFEWGQG